MKLNYALSALLAVSTVTASPIDFFKRKQNNQKAVASDELSASATTTSSNNSNPFFGSAFPTSLFESLNSTTTVTNNTITNGTYSNSTYSNSTHSNSTESNEPSLQVLFTSGNIPISNYTKSNYTTVFNQSSPLNITQLYDVAISVNETIGDSDTKGTVIVTNEKSLEALGFFAAVVFNNSSPIVVTSNATLGSIVANNTDASYRGALVVNKFGFIYSGIFTPSLGSISNGLPLGLINDENEVVWFSDASLPKFITKNSTLRKTYSNFSNVDALDFSFTTPLIPIIYDGGYSEDIIDALANNISGLVVVSSSSSSSNSSITSDLIPVVYTKTSPLSYVNQDDVPVGSIAGGYLTPIKAQVLLAIAAANDVNDSNNLAKLF